MTESAERSAYFLPCAVTFFPEFRWEIFDKKGLMLEVVEPTPGSGGKFLVVFHINDPQFGMMSAVMDDDLLDRFGAQFVKVVEDRNKAEMAAISTATVQ